MTAMYPLKPEQPPSAILFDFGDTLLKLESFKLLPGIAQLTKGIASPIPDSRMDLIVHEFDKRVLRTYSLGHQEFRLIDDIPLLLRDLGTEAIHTLEEYELLIWQGMVTMSPIPDVRSTLSSLKNLGIKLGIVSNAIYTANILQHELKRFNLLEFFDFTISSADVGIRKPHPEMFKLAHARLGLLPSQIWFVGDSWEFDMVGSFLYGFVPVWLNPCKLLPPNNLPYLEIASFEDLLGLVRKTMSS